MQSVRNADTQQGAGPMRYDVLVIGAGFSGLYALHKLRDGLDLSVRVLEKADAVGGTWYWNRYPGARCDSESYYYSYSFSPEIEQEWTFTERYPGHEEIRRYLAFVADRLDLDRDIDLSTEVLGASYDAAAKRWRVTTDRGEYEARFLVTAVGCLSSANVPDIEGLDTFAGEWFHTGAWPHEGVDFTGKRVGQIGTGSTGIQVAPVVAETAAHLTVFQRTANYSVPARNAPLTDEFVADVKANYPSIREHARRATNGHPFDASHIGVLEVDPDERRRRFEEAWRVGGLRFRAAFRDILTDLDANAEASEFIRSKIAEVVRDKVVAEKLTPRDHGFATKRPPIDTHYFETFNRDNVTLVDLKAEPIERIVPEGIATSAATYPLDVIIFATGFDALTGPLLRLNLSGRDGVPLANVWSAGPRTNLGLMAPGFPNLFMVTGPGSPSVLCNMPVALEQHVDWIADCLAHMRDHGHSEIEADEGACEAWGEHVNEVANATLLPMASSSWYLGANVPGKPRAFMPYAGGMDRYTAICEDVAREDYRGFTLA